MPSAARLVYMSTNPKTYGRAHGPGPTTRLWSTSLRPRRRPPSGSVTNETYARDHVSGADPTSASTLSGSAASARSKKLRACATFQGLTLVEPSQYLEIEVHRVGVRRLLRASRLGGDEFGVQRARQARDDLVLHVEQIGERLVEPLGPEMIAGLGVDELDVDAHAVSAALDAAFEHVADVQLARRSLQVDRLALVGEGRVAGDHERRRGCARGRSSGSR